MLENSHNWQPSFNNNLVEIIRLFSYDSGWLLVGPIQPNMYGSCSRLWNFRCYFSILHWYYSLLTCGQFSAMSIFADDQIFRQIATERTHRLPGQSHSWAIFYLVRVDFRSDRFENKHCRSWQAKPETRRFKLATGDSLATQVRINDQALLFSKISLSEITISKKKWKHFFSVRRRDPE